MRNCAVHISISLYLLIGTTYVHNQEITSICAKIHDHTVVEELNYTLVRYEGRNAISGQVIYKVDIKNLLSALTLDLEREGQPVYRMLSMKLDACKFLNGSYNHMPIANLLLRQFNKMKNFAKSCPLKAHQPVVLDLFVLSWKQLPIYLPNMSFTVTAIFFTNRKKYAEIIVKGVTSQISV